MCDTLEKKKEGSLVKCLQEHGVTLDCIFVRWLGKALYYAGKAKLNCHDYDESVTLLQRAIKISKEAVRRIFYYMIKLLVRFFQVVGSGTRTICVKLCVLQKF